MFSSHYNKKITQAFCLCYFMAERMGFSSCYRKVHCTFLLKIFAFGSIFRATCSYPIITKKITQAFCLCYFMAERMGFSSCYRKVHCTFLLKIFAFGSIFRATCSHPIITKKITQAFCLCYFYGGEDGIRTHVAFGQTVFKTASL